MRQRLNHTVELSIRDDQGKRVRSWTLLHLSVAAIFLMIGIGLTIQDVVVSVRYWLLEWQPEPGAILAVLVPVPVGYTPG